MALNVVLSLVLIKVFEALGWLPLGGLALSNSLATTVEMAVLLSFIRRRLRGLEGRRMTTSLARIGLAAGAMGIAVVTLVWLLEGLAAWLVCGVSIAAGSVVYVVSSLVLGASEPQAVWGMVLSGRRRHRG
jgi:peptidoglycan biosynthesis protein MviN/MurJ (putative lipid II flippase)